MIHTSNLSHSPRHIISIFSVANHVRHKLQGALHFFRSTLISRPQKIRVDLKKCNASWSIDRPEVSDKNGDYGQTFFVSPLRDPAVECFPL